ncbi:hypothetical protein DL766_008519 [Monosporascus sp. MC13-8B]|nr:hypothetical protein DL763_006441 [Monosporascus cannonballus]RYP19133.1 hypothetical protein DL766_008519 [Monosporascus sp. MC13-8B]
MPTGSLQRNAYNRRRPRREPSRPSSAPPSPPGIANGPPTELVGGGVYILITTHDRDHDHGPGDGDAAMHSDSSNSTRRSAKKGNGTSRQEADEEPSFTWSLYLQRTAHLGTLYRPGEPPRGVFSIVPRPRARVPVPVAASSSPSSEPDLHHHHRLVGLVQVDRVADGAAMDRAAASAADSRLHRRAHPRLDTAADDERAWALTALRELRAARDRCGMATTESQPESDLLEAVDGWAGRAGRGAMAADAAAAPVAFWWRRDWCWEMPGRVPRDWRDLAYRRYSGEYDLVG